MRSFIPSIIVVVIAVSMGCQSSRFTAKEKSSIEDMLQNEVLKKHFVGFGLYDPAQKEFLLTQNSEKYFTPASNTKILTLYSAVNILENRIATAKYCVSRDTTYLWGMGNPAFLNPYLPASDAEKMFFNNQEMKYCISDDLFQDEQYGSGWAWDDYMYAYQAEKSFWPVFGNLIHINGLVGANKYDVTPSHLIKGIIHVPDTSVLIGTVYRIDSSFVYNDQPFDSSRFEFVLPMKMSSGLVSRLINDSFKVDVMTKRIPFVDCRTTKTLYSDTPVDSIYKVMMQESDNFIAEQLLLNCSATLFDTMNTTKAIRWIQDSLFRDIVDPFQWVDGSGLSRYNMFTPRSIIQLLELIYHQKEMSWIKEIFPSGGISGTIENWYGDENEEAWVWAKTGTLRHNHCLSGYIQCKSGKVLIFSFMHNHFTGSSSKVKIPMERLLRYIRETN